MMWFLVFCYMAISGSNFVLSLGVRQNPRASWRRVQLGIDQQLLKICVNNLAEGPDYHMI